MRRLEIEQYRIFSTVFAELLYRNQDTKILNEFEGVFIASASRSIAHQARWWFLGEWGIGGVRPVRVTAPHRTFRPSFQMDGASPFLGMDPFGWRNIFVIGEDIFDGL